MDHKQEAMRLLDSLEMGVSYTLEECNLIVARAQVHATLATIQKEG